MPREWQSQWRRKGLSAACRFEIGCRGQAVHEANRAVEPRAESCDLANAEVRKTCDDVPLAPLPHGRGVPRRGDNGIWIHFNLEQATLPHDSTIQMSYEFSC